MAEDKQNKPGKLENLKDKSSWGGKREGSGRKEGGENPETKKRRIVENAFQDRILTNIHDLLNSQLNIAKGASYLFKIVETGEGKDKKKEHILVTDPEEMKEVLDEVEGTGVVDEMYYYITTKEPNNKALDSLFDRVFDRPTQKQSIKIGPTDDIVDQILRGAGLKSKKHDQKE